MISIKSFYTLNKLKNKYNLSKPFPHIIIDDFLDKKYFRLIQKELKKFDKQKGQSFNSLVEKEKWISKNTGLPKYIKSLVKELNGKKWLSYLKKFSEIDDLCATLSGNSELANYHEMKHGGYLGPHVDHSSDPKTEYPHVMNIIIYLSDNWKKNWGGGTELYNFNGTKKIKKINYKANRAVIFLHTPYSFHAVSKIKKRSKVRSSIYVDYYSKSFDPYKKYQLDFSKKWFKHGTCFTLNNPIHYLLPKNFYYTKTKIQYYKNKFFSKF